MNDILKWEEIQNFYQNQWVQLIDFDWPEDEPHPRCGKVRLSASSRKDFNKLVLNSEPVDAARLYVGSHQLPEGEILSSNIVKMVLCES